MRRNITGAQLCLLNPAVSTADKYISRASPGKVFFFRDPDAAEDFATVHEIIEANYRDIGLPGLMNQADADVGVDPVEDGDFEATLEAGTYLVVATDEGLTTTSVPQRIVVAEGETVDLAPVVPEPATLTVIVRDGAGALIPAKVILVPLSEDGHLADLDGTRKPAMGEGRVGNGVRHLILTRGGPDTFLVEPGRYRVFASHGPEYSIDTEDLDIEGGRDHPIQLSVVHEVDTTGWISLDAHLHAEPSFDSGMKLERRVTSAAAEHVELAIATDHDVVTDYEPVVDELELQTQIKSGIGVELSTLENGHFVAFPLRYDDLEIPHHDAPDWTCKSGAGILEELSEHIEEGAEGVRIMCHPRDGFIGYISQLDVNPFTGERFDYATGPNEEFEGWKVDPGGLASGNVMVLEGENPIFRESTCDFDAMEVFNSKRFDRMRTPTNDEVVTFTRCMDRILQVPEGDHGALDAACPELGDLPLATCDPGERFLSCKMRHRRALALEMAKQILIRTPEEQLALWTHTWTPGDGDQCDPAEHPPHSEGGVPPEVAGLPCVQHLGVMDDWMRWLDAGLNVTLTAASDSHGLIREPGMPRTLIRDDATTPQDIHVDEIAQAIEAHEALPTYGPVIDVSAGGALPGDLAEVQGESVEVDLRVQTASWFGVDRIEVYVSGLLEEVIELDHGPEMIVDYEGTVTVPAPEEDGFVSVIALGSREENLLGPIYLDVEFGELQLPKVTALAFGSIEGIGDLLPAPAVVPDFFPVFPLAMTNAVMLDVDGDGEWKKGATGPAFCPQPCVADEDCTHTGQTCLEPEGVCGFDIQGECTTGPPGASVGALVEGAP